jgi:16S rRNA pseudouridine516 synthase
VTATPRNPADTLTAADLLYTQGFGTRRECAGLVAAGRLRIAGTHVDDAQQRIEATEGLRFEVDGTLWPFHRSAVIALHKPAGYECSQRPGAWPSVMSLLPPPLRRRGVQPVGRLDQDTTGLLLLTDDGALLHRWTSPRGEVVKVYRVTTADPVDAAQLDRLLAGVVLRDEKAPLRARAALATGPQTLELSIGEGKYHQVKRMLAAAGNRVVALHRTQIGRLLLPPALAAGQWTWIDATAVDAPATEPAA